MTNLTGTIVVGPEGKRLNLYIPRVYLDQIGVNKPHPKAQVTGLSGQWLKIESSDAALEAKIPSHLTVKFEGQFLPKDRAYIQWTPRRGFGLSPAHGKAISELVMHGESYLPLDGYRLGRFADVPRDWREERGWVSGRASGRFEDVAENQANAP